MAHDFTIHKQTVQTYQPRALKEAHPPIYHIHSHIIVADKDKVITNHFTARVIPVDDRVEQRVKLW